MVEPDLQNLITLKGAKDLYGKAKGTGLFNLEQDLDLQDLRFKMAPRRGQEGTGGGNLGR